MVMENGLAHSSDTDSDTNTNFIIIVRSKFNKSLFCKSSVFNKKLLNSEKKEKSFGFEVRGSESVATTAQRDVMTFLI